MKKIITISTITMILLSANVMAQKTGHYQQVGRSNDPFVFCTKGVPQDDWAPINPLQGTWRCTRRKCKGLDTRWIPTYQSICPKALTTGDWTGPGQGEDYKGGIPDKLIPFKH